MIKTKMICDIFSSWILLRVAHSQVCTVKNLSGSPEHEIAILNLIFPSHMTLGSVSRSFHCDF